MSAVDTAVKILEIDEGFSEHPYYDTKGIPTYGHGFVCGKKNEMLPKIHIYLEDSLKRLRGLVEANEKTFLSNPDLSTAYNNCNDVQKAVLLSMAHQLGIYGVLLFKGVLGALWRSDFNKAADEILDSKAAKLDAPKRFKRNSLMIRTGKLAEYYK